MSEMVSPVEDAADPLRGGRTRRFPTFTARETNQAMALALVAWTVAVFDYGLFGTLLPAMQDDFGWSDSTAYLVNTLIAVGTAVVAFGVGPVIDRLGRRRGMMLTVGGTGSRPSSPR